jgi:hypothetical protein
LCNFRMEDLPGAERDGERRIEARRALAAPSAVSPEAPAGSNLFHMRVCGT